MFRTSAVGVVAVAAALALSACGSEPAPAAPAAPQASAPSSAPAVSTTTPPAVPAEAMDAKAVLEALVDAKLPLTSIVAQNEDTDPNGKLGRPGGYTSRASADLPEGDKDADKYDIDRGIVVEVFSTPEDAAGRATYIQDALKSLQFVTPEYHYQPADKRVLVRVTGHVKPSKAKSYGAAVAAL